MTAREPEIEQDHAAIVLDDDVSRLQIAVNNAERVHAFECFAERQRPANHVSPTARIDDAGEGPTGEQLHHDIGLGVHLSDVDKLHNAWNLEQSQCLDLTMNSRLVSGGDHPNALDCHLGTGVGINRAPHHPAATRADRAFHPVALVVQGVPVFLAERPNHRLPV